MRKNFEKLKTISLIFSKLLNLYLDTASLVHVKQYHLHSMSLFLNSKFIIYLGEGLSLSLISLA